jgi:ubiquinol-cytochrome c reductase cytochrome c subunit
MRFLSARLSAKRRSPLAGLVVLLLGLLITGGAYAVLSPANAETNQSDQSTVAEGRKLFLVGCSSCHGQNGEGIVTKRGTQYGPPLAGVGAAAVDFQVGTGRMPLREHGPQAPRKRPTYDEQQTLDLAAYIASLGPGPAIPSFSASDWQKADTAYGGALFRTNCAQCHNFAGSGGALTYGKYAPSLSKATPTQIYEAMITGPENMPVFGDKEITPDQKLAMINYIRTLKTQGNPGGVSLGQIGPVPETMVGWLVGIGLLVLVTLWIGAKA